MQVSVSKLTSHIRKIVPELIREGSAPKSPKLRGDVPKSVGDAILELIGPMIDAEYTRAGLLMRGAILGESCKKCLPFGKLKRAKVLGRGFNGTVFDLGGTRALKVESLSQELVPVDKDGQVPDRGRPFDAAVAMLGKAAQRMGELQIGPKVHGWKVCVCPRTVLLAVEMDKVEGRTLAAFINDKKVTKAQMAKVRTILTQKLQKMHEAGLVHADFHEGNVLVDRKNEPWIIDFSMVVDLQSSGKKTQQTPGRRGLGQDLMNENLEMVRDLGADAARRGLRMRPDKIRQDVLARLMDRGVVKVSGMEDDPGMRFARWGSL